jgi:hypothetical protein
MVLGRLHAGRLVSHVQTSIPDAMRSCPCGRANPSGLERAYLDHRGQLDEPGLVFVGVMLAEQQLSTRRQYRSDAGGRAATVTAISPS